MSSVLGMFSLRCLWDTTIWNVQKAVGGARLQVSREIRVGYIDLGMTYIKVIESMGAYEIKEIVERKKKRGPRTKPWWRGDTHS